jgi:hypothetical protein
MNVDEQLRALDFKPQCEASTPGNGHEADYFARCKSCQKVTFFCERGIRSARQATLTATSAAGSNGSITRCCGQKIPRGGTFDSLFTVEKIASVP